MMQSISYRKNYLLIYIWQSLSILLGFFSLFVVIPYISSDKSLFGIYSVCTSLTIFFSYADLGFLSAGVKYAAEYFIRGEKEKEINMIGFVAFMMLAAFFVVSLVIIVCAIYPTILIPELAEGTNRWYIARWLLFTLAFSCPIMIAQRVLTMVFSIRVEDYKYQRITIVGSLIKISSVFYFFRDGHYELLEYYVFFQVVNLLIVLVAYVFTRGYGYRIKTLMSAFRFNKEMFDKTKKLSATSLVLVISMILYYELDQIIIANYLGIDAVAIYAIALSVMTFVRTFMSLLYSPYSSRYNHYSGVGDISGLQVFVKKVILELSPIVCCPILILACLAYPFVVSWVGESYSSSSYLITIMVFSFLPNFIGTPISSYFIAKEENMCLIKLNVCNVVIYWTGIILTLHFWGVYSFAVFKSISPILIVWGYWHFAKQDFKKQYVAFIPLKSIFRALFIPISVAVISSFIIKNFMWYEHSKSALLYNLLLMGICLALSISVLLLTNKQVCKTVRSLVKK